MQMKRIRFVEEEIARRYSENKMRCPTHLSVGQEAVAAAVGLALRRDDLVVSGHRAHAHYLGKGGDVRTMLAEIYGKVTGCARGKGGSMHLIDEDAGFMGSTAIVGGTVPIGVGLAYGMKVKRTTQVSCIFFGEAVLESGVFFESANFAALKCLPVLFVCENNLYSVYSPLEVRQPKTRNVELMVHSLGIPAQHGDGNDGPLVFDLAQQAISRIRAGSGPQFLEFATYRWREHCGPNYDNHIGYRTETEFLEWKERDPVARLEKAMLASGEINSAALRSIEFDIEREIHSAFEFAETSPFPEHQEAYVGVYADERAAGG